MGLDPHPALCPQELYRNKESRRFFPAASPDAQRIKPRNRVHFGTLMDAFLAGYAPARQTNPWPEAEEK